MFAIPPLSSLLLQSRTLDQTVLTHIESDALYAYAPATVRSLVAAYNEYPAWCTTHNLCPVPAAIETVVLYYKERSAVLGPQAIRNRRKIITLLHKYYDLPSPNDHPFVRLYLRARLRAAEPSVPKEAFTPEDIRAMVRIAEGIENPFHRDRDRTLITFLFGGASRAGETAHALAKHVRFFPNHLAWTIPRSKTDQYNEGYTVFIGRAEDPRFCPVELMRTWRERYHGQRLFCRISRSGNAHSEGLTTMGITLILKQYARAIGLDPKNYAGHSMRSGFVTAGYASDVPEDLLQAVTRQSINTLRKYNREQRDQRYNLTRALGF